jgi:hypothetical protein
MVASILGGTAVAIGVTRVLPFIIPTTIFIAIGIDWVVTLISTRLPHRLMNTLLFVLLVGGNLLLLRDALINGPTWFTNYGLGGMQYGAKQVSEVIWTYLEEDPDTRVFLSPDWANGVDVTKRFFFPDDAPVYLGGSASFTEEPAELDEHTLLVMTPAEFDKLRADPKIGDLDIEFTLTNPDWTPGFYFLRIEYSDEAEAIFEQERLERLKPRYDTAQILGQTVEIEHPYFDSGGIEHMLDDDSYTFARVYEANPTQIRITFPVPTSVEGLRLTTGSMDFILEARLFADPESEPIVYKERYVDLPDDPTVQVEFDQGPEAVSIVEIEILSTRPADPVKIHIRDLILD